MNKLFGQLRDAQSKMQEIQEEVGKLTTDAEAGAGVVKVQVNGKRQVTRLEVKPELLTPEDAGLVQDLIVAAVNQALQEMEATIQREMQQRAGGMFNLPGMNFGG
ncbi:MAG: YbaB/EbfC family nucleoid-associated protein [Catalinimonas sp.]